MPLDLPNPNRQEEKKMDETKEKLIRYEKGERELIKDRLRQATEKKIKDYDKAEIKSDYKKRSYGI